MSANINKPKGHPNRERRGSGPVGARRADGRVVPTTRGSGTPFLRMRRVQGARTRIQKRINEGRPHGPYPHPTKRGPGRV